MAEMASGFNSFLSEYGCTFRILTRENAHNAENAGFIETSTERKTNIAPMHTPTLTIVQKCK